MNVLTVENLTKFYGQTRVLDDVSFDCRQGEFFTLFGPSGAGKTTILELIAGMTGDYAGRISIHERSAKTLAIQDRNVAMAFENYALYPHFTVGENIAFPLRSPRTKKIGDAAIAEKVQWTADELGIGHLLDRNPAQLSGGQKQRVALARALVREADVYLLDEPIAHLDAKLRTVARANLKAMARNLGATIIYVTHDFREALGLSDRLLILNEGKVLQIGEPREIYAHPRTDYVGFLLGNPAINLIDGEVEMRNRKPVFHAGSTVFALSGQLQAAAAERISNRNTSCRLGIRPSCVSIYADARRGATELNIYAIEHAADHLLIYFEVAGTFFGGIAAPSGDFSVGKPAWVALKKEHGHLFEATFDLANPTKGRDAA